MTAGAPALTFEPDAKLVRRVALELARRRYRRSHRRLDKAIEALDRALASVEERLEQFGQDEAVYLEGVAAVARELHEEETAWSNS